MRKPQLDRFFEYKNVVSILGKDFLPTELHKRRLNSILHEYSTFKAIESWIPAIAYMVLYNLTNYTGRLRRLKALGRKKQIRYGMLIQFGKDNFEKYIKQHTEKRTKHFRNRKQYWLSQGLDEAAAIDKVSEIQKSCAAQAAKKLKGTSEYSCRSITYWLSLGYSLEDARLEVKRVQGREHSAERNAKWLKTLSDKPLAEKELISLKKGHSVESYMAKGMTEKEATKLSRTFFAKRRDYSLISQKLFEMVEAKLDTTCYFKLRNYEKQFNGKNVDFYSNSVVIEFYGDYWHANPERYTNDFVIYGKTAKQIWQDDKDRLDLILKHPAVSKIGIVWESEFRKNPDIVIQSILQFIKGEI